MKIRARLEQYSAKSSGIGGPPSYAVVIELADSWWRSYQTILIKHYADFGVAKSVVYLLRDSWKYSPYSSVFHAAVFNPDGKTLLQYQIKIYPAEGFNRNPILEQNYLQATEAAAVCRILNKSWGNYNKDYSDVLNKAQHILNRTHKKK